MRLLGLFLAISFCGVGTIHAADDSQTEDNAVVSETSSQETIQVDGETLTLAFEGETDGDTIKEFIPAEQTLETWTQLAAVRHYAKLDDPKALAGAVVRQLQQRKPPANFELLENETSDDVLLDFIIWPEDGSFAEFNIFLYRPTQDNGLVMYQYALRAYGDDAEEFIKSLQADRRAKLIAATVQWANEENAE